MTKLVHRFSKNTKGRDLIVGDIHGCFTKLGKALLAIGFDKDRGDRLFSVGDLVDRGPESIECLNFLAFADGVVSGNHEAMAVEWTSGSGMDISNYRANGGAWMIALDAETQREISAALSDLPIAIEIETDGGIVGIVHAECPLGSWPDFVRELASSSVMPGLIDAAQWSRNRITFMHDSHVSGVRAVVVGHTPMERMTSLGNTIFIDTMGWRPQGEFTILDAATLEAANPQ